MNATKSIALNPFQLMTNCLLEVHIYFSNVPQLLESGLRSLHL